MQHAYLGVRCTDCEFEILLKDLGPHQPVDIPAFDKFSASFEVSCEACGELHTYSFKQLIVLHQESIVRPRTDHLDPPGDLVGKA